MLRLHYFSSPPSTLEPFVFFSEAAAVSEDTPSALLCTEDISTFYGQTHPLAGDVFKAWLSGSIALKASLLRLVLQLKGKSISFFPPHLPVSRLLVVSVPFPPTHGQNVIMQCLSLKELLHLLTLTLHFGPQHSLVT